MEDLQKGDRIVFRNKTEEVLARLEDIIFTRPVYKDSVGDLQEPILLEDLIVYGWKKA